MLKTELSHKRERIAFGNNKKRPFSPSSLCSGFTNTSHVNEAGSISVVPGAWIVFEEKKKEARQREKDGAIMFLRANTKQFCSSHRESHLSALHLLFFPTAARRHGCQHGLRGISVRHEHKASEIILISGNTGLKIWG